MTENIEFVDLGLQSGTKWMKCNIGAEKETDYGLYFQWGDTVGYSGNEALTHSTLETSPCNVEKKENLKKWEWYDMRKEWNKKNITDEVLNNDVDAVFVHTKGKAKLPNCKQFCELCTKTNTSWAIIDGIFGRKFVNRNDSSKYIFIPSSGRVNKKGIFDGIGGCCGLWSNETNKYTPRYLYLNNIEMRLYEESPCIGYAVRGVSMG